VHKAILQAKTKIDILTSNIAVEGAVLLLCIVGVQGSNLFHRPAVLIFLVEFPRLSRYEKLTTSRSFAMNCSLVLHHSMPHTLRYWEAVNKPVINKARDFKQHGSSGVPSWSIHVIY
jgi:hypothetical protein